MSGSGPKPITAICALSAGETAKLETLAIGCFDDARIGQELFADAIARQYDIHLRPAPAGYCTWYSQPHGGAADEKSIITLAECAAKELKPFGFSFVQIDDQWQDGKERNGPARRFTRAKPDGPYPHGMKPVAERLRATGTHRGHLVSALRLGLPGPGVQGSAGLVRAARRRQTL